MTIDLLSGSGFSNSSTTGLRVYTTGITKPTIPAFSASSNVLNPINAAVVFGVVRFNVGSYYNSSNGYFSAPVAGTYFFRYQQLGVYADSSEYRPYILRNGAIYNNTDFITVKAANTWQTMYAEDTIYMNAGDNCCIYVYSASVSTLYNDSNYCSFSGHLVC